MYLLCAIFFFFLVCLFVFLQPCTAKQIHKVVIIVATADSSWFATTSYTTREARLDSDNLHVVTAEYVNIYGYQMIVLIV